MNRRILLLALIGGLLYTSGAAYAGGKDGEDVQRRSGPQGPVDSYPLPFVKGGDNPRTSPSISTGYYFVDSEDEAPDFWRPDPTQFVDTLTEPATWRRIVSGPNQFPAGYWTDPTQNVYGGFAYFRNPGSATDSTDDAFAGPISLGFPFYFNGVRYDSIYISTNGLLALSNRRYFYEYNQYGWPTNRQVAETSPGNFTSYDPASDDLRPRTGDGISDATNDDWGYQYVACGGAPTTATRGIRTRTNVELNETALSGSGAWTNVSGSFVRPALIAPCWDDMQVSVYNSEYNVVDDYARVYFKRSPSNDKFIVYYVNLTPIRAKSATTGGGPVYNVTFEPDNRPGIGEHYSFNVQITLDRNDSSIRIQYERFFGTAPRSAINPYAARIWLRCNSTVGVTGPARRLNWAGFPAAMPANTTLDYNAVKYTQFTEYWFNVDMGCATCGIRATSTKNDLDNTPNNNLAIKFKQWKNMLRVIQVYYRTHPLNNNSPLDFSVTIPSAQANNYEILAGETRLGVIQPVAIVQNLTNDVQGPQGVNYVKQGINFKVRFRIINEATGEIVYNTSKGVSNSALRDPSLSDITLCDINGNSRTYTAGHLVKPYEFVKVTFPPFEPNPFIDAQIGRMFTSVVAEPRDTNGVLLGDEWPFDDTTGIRLFSMRRLNGFNDDVTEFHIVGGTAMPSVLKWVNIEADVVDGEGNTNNPPPPRGLYYAANSTIQSRQSPVIRLNRMNLGGTDIPAFNVYGGDELRSFPVNLSNRKKAVLSLSYQRTGKMSAGFGRGFSDNRLIGPEHQVNLRNTSANYYFQTTDKRRLPDQLFVEFATPSNDGLNGITNIKKWVYDPANLGNAYLQPYTIWGGGGYGRGFDLTSYNTQLDKSFTPGTGGLREDLFDDGKDFEFFKITLPIPDSILNWVNEGARNFRFRFQVSALRNSGGTLPADDEDNFYIDNVKILFPDEVTDVEFANIQLIWPYTMAPASQATRIPIRVKLANNTDLPAPAFSVRLQIKPDGNEVQQIYCRTITVPILAGNREVLLPFPDVNFRNTTPGKYKVTGKIFFPGNDLDTTNDTTFTEFTILYGPSFAYEENPQNPVNDVPKIQFSGVTGKGLNHKGYSYGGNGANYFYFYPYNYAGYIPYTAQIPGGYMYGRASTPPDDTRYGADAGNASGQLAARFTLYSQDTVNGYQAFFAELNQDFLNISFALYPDQGGVPGNPAVPGSMIYRRRGEDETGQWTEPQFGKYVTYLLEKPVVLAPGEYWVSVAQMGTEGYELGASASRMGMVTTLFSDIPTYGTANRTMLIDKNFRVRARNGSLLNDNRFAYELTRGSGDWVQFTPSIGNPAYAHLDALGFSLGFPTFTQGSWIPLLRPYFGDRSYSSPPRFVDCVVPVELTFFEAKARQTGIDLFWETASEENNQGFDVERRARKEMTDVVTGEPNLSCVDNNNLADAPWQNIGFIAGSGNSTQTVNYRFFDDNVQNGFTYEYRLRQRDFDGQESFSNVVSVVKSAGGVALADNFPNPVSSKTTFAFTIPNRSDVKLEVFDMVGNLVTTLYDGTVPGQSAPYAVEWNGLNQAGQEVSSGAYMYKLTAGDVVLSKTLTIVR